MVDHFKMNDSLVSTLSIKMITKRHHIQVIYHHGSHQLALKGAGKNLRKLTGDRGWRQFNQIYDLELQA